MVLILICIFAVACTKESTEKYVARKTGLDLSHCEIEKDKDTHGGFHGDGEMLAIFNCNNKDEKIINQINNWDSLPLTENLELIMYGGKKDGITYNYKLASENGIPKITNGYYNFINRHSSALNESDDDIFNKYSFNFTIVLYDSDTQKMYYYEFDT